MEEQNNQFSETPQEVPENHTPSFLDWIKGNPKKAMVGGGALLALIFLSVILIAAFARHPINKLTRKIERNNNYQIELTMEDVPFLGTFTLRQQVDGNVTYTPSTIFSIEEAYTEKVKDVTYQYTKNLSGEWKKEKLSATDEDDPEILDFYEDLLDSDNYTKVKGEKNVYKLKSDVDLDDFSDVVIKVEDGNLIISLCVTSEGLTCSAKIVISKINKVKLTLPEV